MPEKTFFPTPYKGAATKTKPLKRGFAWIAPGSQPADFLLGKSTMDLAIALDNNSSKPLHQQLYEELRQAILSGRLTPGERIPSTRALSKSLSISRFTVTTSYEQLLSEGYLETIIGSGTFVCKQIPDDLIQSNVIERIEKINPSSIKLSRYGETLVNTVNVPRIAKPKLQII
ncbi:MAG: winged helix-turn-helix domain-containing protein [Cyanobacteria bacterium J06635_10]